MKIREKIINLIREAVNWEVKTEFYNMREQELRHTSQLVRLMMDVKNDRLSMESRDFLCEMNIHPDLFRKTEIFKDLKVKNYTDKTIL